MTQWDFTIENDFMIENEKRFNDETHAIALCRENFTLSNGQFFCEVNISF